MPSSFDAYFDTALNERAAKGLLRTLQVVLSKIDFTSNDYLGIARNADIQNHYLNRLQQKQGKQLNGSTGSRLLSGNSDTILEFEHWYAGETAAESALIFNSGYDANVGLFSSIIQRNEVVLCDELNHASIIDGIRLSRAKRIRFKHNDLNELEKKLRSLNGRKYVAVESVYSMEGDLCPLNDILGLCEQYNAALIVDEAHAVGIMGSKGLGLVDELQLSQHPNLLARIHTFGKAIGCHGACILGSARLKQYLINFARSLIYSTALPPHHILLLRTCLEYAMRAVKERAELLENISVYNSQMGGNLYTPIKAYMIHGNEATRMAASVLQKQGFDVRPILSPTVAPGTERLRIVLHAFNTSEEIKRLTQSLHKIS